MVVVTTKEKDEKQVIKEMVKRVDRLMKVMHNDIHDGDFRFELVTDLVAVRRKLAERNGDE